MKNVLIVLGTRPEAIKLAPIILCMRQSKTLHPVVCSTGQHKEMLDMSLADFGIVPDVELGVLRPGQSLSALSGQLFKALGTLLAQAPPAAMIVQGDTATASIGSMCGFLEQIPVGHVEAGLRSGNMAAPFPEEFNRRVVSLATAWHFAPTEDAVQNLLREGIPVDRIFLTGNTVVDALLYIRDKVRADPPLLPDRVERMLHDKTPFVLITGHRRENHGRGMLDICSAILALARKNPGHAFVYPVHLNPKVHDVVIERLGAQPNIYLIPPCPYRQFVRMLDSCTFIISDSGGIQEEAPSLGKHVFVLRESTERPEGIRAGVCELVGTDVAKILARTEQYFKGPVVSPKATNPYGNGDAAQRIVSQLESLLV